MSILVPQTRSALAKQRQVARERFLKARIAEREYARHLNTIGRHIGHIISGFAPRGVVEDFERMRTALSSYGRLLEPWAESVTTRMHADVSRRDLRAWKDLSHSIGAGLEHEVTKTPVGQIMRDLLSPQVKLITSLPTEAAERVHALALQMQKGGGRADALAAEIMRSGKVSANRAIVVALTETSRTASALTEARSLYIGSVSYWWRTTGDISVRPEHRELNGTLQQWSSPPIVTGPGQKVVRAHPGCWVRCRCWPEPVLPDRIR